MHSKNPVAWQTWSVETIKLAKMLNRPIFLSSGYSSCHWCKVMEKESFEDEEIAKILNEKFIPIKLDKDEYPDVDKTYQFYLQSTGLQGGWPLSVFLNQDLKPFYGGTYFPPEQKGEEFTSFKEVLNNVVMIFNKKRYEIDKVVRVREKFLDDFYTVPAKVETNRDKLAKIGINEFKKIMDKQYGGFRESAKFPYISSLLFLADYAEESQDVLEFLCLTANNMVSKGLYDHINGGFFRYTMDRQWLRPHFEKMLLDNALIPRFLFKMFELTEDRIYLYIGKQVIDFVISNMITDYGILNSIDADSLDGNRNLVEGYYYKVNDVVFSILAEDELKFLIEEIHVDNGLVTLKKLDFVKRVAIQPIFDKVSEKIGTSRSKPIVDNKVVTSSNYIFCTTLLDAFEATADEYYLEYAKLLYVKIGDYMLDGKELFRGSYGDKRIENQTLEDYVFYIEASLRFFEITKDKAFINISSDALVEIKRKFMRKDGLLKVGINTDFVETFDDDKPNPLLTLYYLSLKYADLMDFDISEVLERFVLDKAHSFPTGHSTVFKKV